MTIHEFESYIRKGLGRAILFLRQEEDKAPFFDSVWKNAIEEVRYDHRCNGPRGHYIKSLFDCFDDSDILLSKLFSAYCDESADHENIFYYISNLSTLADEGVVGAKDALENIYGILFDKLLHTENPYKDGIDYDTVNFDHLSYLLYGMDNSILDKLIHDRIILLKNSTHYGIVQFCDFFNTYLNVLKNENYTEIIDSLKNDDAEFKEMYEKGMENLRKWYPKPADMSSIPKPTNWRESIEYSLKDGRFRFPVHDSVWKNLSREDEDEITRLIEEEKDINRRIAIIFKIRVFRKDLLMRYPRDPSPLIEELLCYADKTFTHSPDDNFVFELSRLVSHICHEAVRDFALKTVPHFKENSNSIVYSAAFDAWMTNYHPEDDAMLIDYVKSISDENMLYCLGLRARLSENDFSDSLLLYMYENTPSSTCRSTFFERLLKKYSRSNDLPEQLLFILKEAEFDCDEHTRVLAADFLKQRTV